MSELNTLYPLDEIEALPRRDRKKLQTRWRIYESAIELMKQYGYDNVTIEDICELADVSNALFFRHFTNKAALIRAYLDLLKAKIGDALRASPSASSTEKLRIVCREVGDSSPSFVAFTPQLLAEMAVGGHKFDVEHVDTGLTGAMSIIIADGQKSGEFNSSWHPEVAALSLIGAWLILTRAAQAKGFPKRAFAEALDMTIAGLRGDGS